MEIKFLQLSDGFEKFIEPHAAKTNNTLRKKSPQILVKLPKPIIKYNTKHTKERKSELGKKLANPDLFISFKFLVFMSKSHEHRVSKPKQQTNSKSCTLPSLEFFRPKLHTQTRTKNATFSTSDYICGKTLSVHGS